jgi:hypothetical protein
MSAIYYSLDRSLGVFVRKEKSSETLKDEMKLSNFIRRRFYKRSKQPKQLKENI